MKLPHFQTQIARLIDTYGPNAYGNERVKLIWREVSEFDDAWFTQLIDKLIGECARPPLMPEFRTEIAIERERRHQIRKEQESRDAETAYQTIFSSDEIKNICGTIKDRVRGMVKDQEFECFQAMLGNAVRGK